MSVIKVENLKVDYNQVNALNKVSFEVGFRDFVGIIGPNGGGKTTLVRTLLGLLQPTEGTVEIGKNEVVGYVPQFSTFDRSFPINVEEVILSGHLPRKIKFMQRYNNHDTEHSGRIMERLGITELRKRQIGKLSGGQLQRVLIARALMNHPTVLILDEPTAGVDEENREEIYRLLKELNQAITILIISHNTNELFDYLDRVIYINKTVHIHRIEDLTGRKPVPLEEGCCPIDWFIQGEKIQEDMLAQKGAKE